MEQKFKLTKEKFINWYFDDADTRIDFGYNAIKELQLYGKFNTTIEELFDTCGYIPQWICEDQSINDEDDLGQWQVELI